MAAPLIDLLKSSGLGSHHLAWTVECEIAFGMIKTALTSAPFLRHFDPALWKAVHIDAWAQFSCSGSQVSRAQSSWGWPSRFIRIKIVSKTCSLGRYCLSASCDCVSSWQIITSQRSSMSRDWKMLFPISCCVLGIRR